MADVCGLPYDVMLRARRSFGAPVATSGKCWLAQVTVIARKGLDQSVSDQSGPLVYKCQLRRTPKRASKKVQKGVARP